MPDIAHTASEMIAGMTPGVFVFATTNDPKLVARFESTIEVTIPPPKNAVLSPNAAQDPTVRDRHIADISVRGRMGWQRASGYNQRSRAETLMSRWKTVIGPKLKARSFKHQKTETKIGVRILNRMNELGRPNFERTA
jgi:hypothetical protein